MENKTVHQPKSRNSTSKKEFNPLWALLVMGLLIGIILVVELFGLKPQH